MASSSCTDTNHIHNDNNNNNNNNNNNTSNIDNNLVKKVSKLRSKALVIFQKYNVFYNEYSVAKQNFQQDSSIENEIKLSQAVTHLNLITNLYYTKLHEYETHFLILNRILDKSKLTSPPEMIRGSVLRSLSRLQEPETCKLMVSTDINYIDNDTPAAATSNTETDDFVIRDDEDEDDSKEEEEKEEEKKKKGVKPKVIDNQNIVTRKFPIKKTKETRVEELSGKSQKQLQPSSVARRRELHSDTEGESDKNNPGTSTSTTTTTTTDLSCVLVKLPFYNREMYFNVEKKLSDRSLTDEQRNHIINYYFEKLTEQYKKVQGKKQLKAKWIDLIWETEMRYDVILTTLNTDKPAFILDSFFEIIVDVYMSMNQNDNRQQFSESFKRAVRDKDKQWRKTILSSDEKSSTVDSDDSNSNSQDNNNNN